MPIKPARAKSMPMMKPPWDKLGFRICVTARISNPRPTRSPDATFGPAVFDQCLERGVIANLLSLPPLTIQFVRPDDKWRRRDVFQVGKCGGIDYGSAFLQRL